MEALERTEENNVNYSNPDNDPNGPWRTGDVRNALYRRNLIFDITTPSGKVIKPPPNGWRWSRETIASKIKSGEIVFSKDESRIIRKIYLNRVAGRTPETIWFGKDVGTTRDATGELKELFGGVTPFDTPKPSTLIKRIIDVVCDGNDDIILDFFAGSSTTAHAVLHANRDNNSNRQFIMVQLPEPIGDTKYSTIAEIGKDRIRRVLEKLGSQPALVMKEHNEDLGFKVLTLGPSNFRAWRDYTGNSVGDLQKQFDLFEESPLADGWTPDGLLTEVLLIEGFPLDSTITPQTQWEQNTVSCITSPACAHRLWTCFDETLHPNTVNGLALSDQDVFICRDSALDDNAKLRLSQNGTSKTI